MQLTDISFVQHLLQLPLADQEKLPEMAHLLDFQYLIVDLGYENLHIESLQMWQVMFLYLWEELPVPVDDRPHQGIVVSWLNWYGYGEVVEALYHYLYPSCKLYLRCLA